MKLYLNNELESIFVLKEIDTLVREMVNDPKFNLEDIESIDLVRETIDPAQVFLDYWVEDIDNTISNERQQYIKNALYAVKGSPEVFNVINRCFDILIEWNYDFPELEIVFDTISVPNLTKFDNMIRYLLYHLLYFAELNLYIKNLFYELRGKLINNHATIIVKFHVVETEWDNGWCYE